MKVTKNIREYIEKKVYEKAMNSESMLELERKANEAREQFDADMTALEEKCKPFLQQLIDKYPNCTYNDERTYIAFRGVGTYTLPEIKAYRDARMEMSSKARDAAQEIIVEMELGGTKAELMEKLDALKF